MWLALPIRSEITMKAIAQGNPVPGELLGELRDSTLIIEDRARLRKRLVCDGYVLLRSIVPLDVALDARREVFERLAAVGEIKRPAVDGVATGVSRRRELVNDLGDFWRDVCSGRLLRKATHGSHIGELMTLLLGQAAQPHDYMFLRPGRPGLSTRLHYDLPFFARGSKRILTAWLALGEIPIHEGPLAIVEGSNQYEDLIEPIRTIDYDSTASPSVQVMEDSVAFVAARKSRFLTTHFAPGDVVVFDMLTMHGTFDNCSESGRVRLSCDVRWQPTVDEIDRRYRGENPAGTTGAGYGELNGAKPLTDEWHVR